MELFIVLLVAGAIFTFFTLFAGDKQNLDQDLRLDLAGSSARITLTEATQINRLASLSLGAPELTLQLAARLSGDAWQVAHISLCSVLLRLGREEEALQLLSRLDAPHRALALEQMLQGLVDDQQADKAPALQARLNSEQPRSPLLRSALLLAEGRMDDAQNELNAIAQDNALNDLQLLTLARLQHNCGMVEAALASLGKVQTMLTAEEASIYDWHPLLQTMADFQQYTALLELAKLSEEHKRHIAELLMARGQHEQAMQLLSSLDATSDYLLDYEQFLGDLIRAQRHDLAQQLLASANGSALSRLLEHYLDWYAQQGNTTEAQKLLDSQAERLEPSTFNWLVLTLAEHHLESQASWAAALQRQSDRLVNNQKGQPEWAFMRLLSLRYQLQAQAKRPENQRDSWTTRTLLEEASRLHAELDFDDSLTQRALHCELLQALGEPEPARQLLTQVRQELDAAQSLDEDDRLFHYDAIAATLIKLGELEQAAQLQEQGLTHDWFKEDLLQAYIEAQRLEEALALLDFRALLGVSGDSALSRLYQCIDALKEQDPQRHQRLSQQLFARLDDDTTWQHWGRIDAQPQPATA